MNKIKIVLLLILLLEVVFSTKTMAEEDSLGRGYNTKYRKPFAVKIGGERKVIFGNNNEIKNEKKYSMFTKMRFSGYSRSYFLYRDMKDYYKINPGFGMTTPFNLTLGDGYQEPLILLRMQANVATSTSLQIEYIIDNKLLRNISGQTDSLGRAISVYRMLQFTSITNTSIGRFKLIAGGGINWYNLSPFTLGANGVQLRGDMFDRYPWEGEGKNFDRYNGFYLEGSTPRDQRWSMSATQGFILEGAGLPAGLNVSVLYGKGYGSAGYQSYLTKRPMNLFGGRVSKKIRNHTIGYNYVNQFGYDKNNVVYKKIADVNNPSDTFFVDKDRLSQLVTTVDGLFKFENFQIYSELGTGSYLSSAYNEGLKINAKTGLGNVSRYKRKFEEVIFGELDYFKGISFPFKIAYYRIGAQVVNVGSGLTNTSVEEAALTSGQASTTSANYDGLLTDIGVIATNRQGVNLSTIKKLGNLIAKLSMGVSQELVNQAGDLRNGSRAYSNPNLNTSDRNAFVPYTNSITFQHHLSGLTRSRFALYQNNYGPYGRLQGNYRRTYENIVITDSIVNYKKSFSVLDFELKYKFTLFNRSFLAFAYFNYASVQDKFSVLPVFTDEAFLRNYFQEVNLYYNIHPKVTLVGYWGIEFAKGNKRTELADQNGKLIMNANGRPIQSANGKPIDQRGSAYGLGFDFDFNKRACLNIRNRWFYHKDVNFILDKFSGNEITLEVKVFF